MSIALTYQLVTHQGDELTALIEGCIQNERSAQAKLYHIFYPKMVNLVRRYISEEEAVNAIMNRAFLRIFQKIDKYEFKGSFEGWMRTIFKHAVTNYARKNVRYKENILLKEKEEVIPRDYTTDLYYKDLLKLISALPDNLRITFNMFAIEGMSHREIAHTLNIKEGTSKWYVSEARRLLKEKIEALKLHIN